MLSVSIWGKGTWPGRLEAKDGMCRVTSERSRRLWAGRDLRCLSISVKMLQGSKGGTAIAVELERHSTSPQG